MIEEVVLVDPESLKSAGYKDQIYERKCNGYQCENIFLKVEKIEEGERLSVSKNRIMVTGLAVTQKPVERLFIPKETFEKYGDTLVGKPLADSHGAYPWGAIKVMEILGVVRETWFDDDREAMMFKAEVWDENAIEVLKQGVFINFSVAFWWDGHLDKIEDEYEEEQDIWFADKMIYDHIALLPDPQVPESEVHKIEELSVNKDKESCEAFQKTYRHNSKTRESEPGWGSVDKTRLPWNAFSNLDSLDKKKKSTWKYPHHWIFGDEMYLHRGGLVFALAAAKGARSGKRAAPEVFRHLNKHVKAINLSYEEVEEGFKELGCEDLLDNEIKEMLGDASMTKEKDKDAPQEEDLWEEEEAPVEEETQEEETQDEETPEEAPEEKPEKESEETPDEEETPEETPEESEETETSSEEETSEEPEKLSVEMEALKDGYTNLQKENEDLKAKVEELLAEKKEANIDKEVKELLNSGKITPAKADETKQLLKTMNEDQIKAFKQVLENQVPLGKEKGSTKKPEEKQKDDGNEGKPKKKTFIN